MQIKNKRIISLLKILSEKSQSMTGRYLADCMGVSERTIRNDIKEVDYILQGMGAFIEAKANHGYRLVVENSAQYEKLKSFLGTNSGGEYIGNHIIPSDGNDRISFIIAHILLNTLQKKIVLQETLADELFISLSTLKKYLNEIKRSLLRFGLELKTDRANGIRIDGDEAKIRYCISEYVFNRNDMINLAKNSFFNHLFPQEELEFVKQSLLRLILKYDIHLTDIAFKNLLVHIIITIRRNSTKNTVEYSEEEKNRLSTSIYFAAVNELLDIVAKELGINIDNENYYLTQHFVASQKFIESNDILDNCQPLVEEILSNISINIGIDLSDDDELVTGLTIHLITALHRLKFNMNIRNDILEPIKNTYPLAFEMALVASEVIEKEELVKTNESEIGFLAIHFGASLERNQYNEEIGKTVWIVCGAGLSTASLLKAKLKRHFGELIKIKGVASCREVTADLLQQVDYIFSSVPIKHIESEKIIYVEPILTEKDLVIINSQIAKNSTNSIEYEKIFNPELFFDNLKADSSFEAIEKITDAMMEKGYIDQKTKTSIIEREKLSSTELSGMIAVPHAIESYVEDVVIGVAVLERPIIWNRVNVQMVFLLCIPRAFYKVLEPVIQKIYRNFAGGNGFYRVEKDKTFQTMLNILKEG